MLAYAFLEGTYLSLLPAQLYESFTESYIRVFTCKCCTATLPVTLKGRVYLSSLCSVCSDIFWKGVVDRMMNPEELPVIGLELQRLYPRESHRRATQAILNKHLRWHSCNKAKAYLRLEHIGLAKVKRQKRS